MEQMRLDRFLSEYTALTRKEGKEAVKNGRVTVDGLVTKEADIKVSPAVQRICLDRREIAYETFLYLMLHKPAGVVTATEDKRDRTVMELIKEPTARKLAPVGRLDKDTEGLLLITNDGELTHRLLSPKKHVDKVYFAKVNGMLSDTEVDAFTQGVRIQISSEETYRTLPAKLKILSSGEISEAEITIQEGKFHQVKKMFLACGKEVIYLKRLQMGTLKLPENLEPGEYRRLTEDEINLLKENI